MGDTWTNGAGSVFELTLLCQPDCVSLIHEILSREAPSSAWCFLSCCKQLRSMHLRAVVLGIRAAWTDFK